MQSRLVDARDYEFKRALTSTLLAKLGDNLPLQSSKIAVITIEKLPRTTCMVPTHSPIRVGKHLSETHKMSEQESRLAARELPSAVNTRELLALHEAVNGAKVRTRFPPEPNGYLHAGHAKSMNMNFDLAFEKLNVAKENRETIFRYDDTNPEAESKEYIDSLREDVEWLGWKPVRTTFTSDYFDKLYELAIELIKRGKAYVCHQSKAEIEISREVCRKKLEDSTYEGSQNSPWRDRPVAESLQEFQNMRKGMYASSEATLRMKMDMSSPNPNMWDQVAYRIKYVPHPHAGDKWCIYPTYDYTHCIIDSLEHIDYSICTLEFETRRESYFWVLEALDMYRPNVYEMSRLNITNTVLSKRKLLKLVDSKYMRGWDDPRMPTIKGLRRRGYTREIINDFCREIGVTRTANVVQYDKLAYVARTSLHETSPRVMAVLNPLKVIISNKLPATTSDVPYFPFDVTREHHTIPVDSELYIDKSDFKLNPSDDYYGLSPGKIVGLKYAFRIQCDSYEVDQATGDVCLVRCSAIHQDERLELKAKVAVQWVPVSYATRVEVRDYNSLFVSEEPNDADWEAELNPQSEIVYKNAIIDKSIISHATFSHEAHYQFERIGFYVVDKDTTADHIVFNLTVSLKDSKPKEVNNKSRKEEQAKQAAEKAIRMTIPAMDMFRVLSEYADLFGSYDADGLPLTSKDGTPVTKSMSKKLKKDHEKQKELHQKYLDSA